MIGIGFFVCLPKFGERRGIFRLGKKLLRNRLVLEGKRGAFVKPTKLADTKRPDNRGCMSQNCANWLAGKGRRYPDILRHFYGADLELGKSDAVVEVGQAKPASDGLPGVAIAATLASFLFRQ